MASGHFFPMTTKVLRDIYDNKVEATVVSEGFCISIYTKPKPRDQWMPWAKDDPAPEQADPPQAPETD